MIARGSLWLGTNLGKTYRPLLLKFLRYHEMKGVSLFKIAFGKSFAAG